MLYHFYTPRHAAGLLLLAIVSSAAAAPSYTYVGTLSGGAMWENAGETEHLEIIPGVQTKYKSNKESNTLGTGEVFVGGQYDSEKDWQAQFGIAFGGMSEATLEGDVYSPGSDGVYRFKLNQTRLVAKAKILGNLKTHFKNYVSASLGTTFYDAHDFENTSLVPDFEDHSGNAFTYSAGIGMQYVISKNWQIGLGYEFTDWGKTHLGSAPGQTSDNRLEVDHFYTNGLIFNISFAG